jgi:biotin carboxyl carrier protein
VKDTSDADTDEVEPELTKEELEHFQGLENVLNLKGDSFIPIPKPEPLTSSTSPEATIPTPLLVRMPELKVGHSTLSKYTKQVNDKFEAGEILCEIDSDLAVFDYRAPQRGTLISYMVKEGEELKPEQVIAVIVPSCELNEEQLQVARKWVATEEKTLEAKKYRNFFSDTIASL